VSVARAERRQAESPAGHATEARFENGAAKHAGGPPDRRRESRSSPPVRLSTVALPNEHGAWAFVLEPALLGLLTWPSAAGVLVAAAGLFALLVQHPLSLVLADVRRRKRYPRTRVAATFVASYGALLVTATTLAVLTAQRTDAFLLILPAAPLALAQLAFDARNQGRRLAPELAGSVAMASLAALILRVGGAPWSVALVAWTILAARNLASIPYVRARLERQRGVPAGQTPIGVGTVYLAHAAGLLWVTATAVFLGTPWWAVAAFGVLLARALVGLRDAAPAVPAKRIGLLEMAYGLVVVAAMVAQG
jgi:hypothetical protein